MRAVGRGIREVCAEDVRVRPASRVNSSTGVAILIPRASDRGILFQNGKRDTRVP